MTFAPTERLREICAENRVTVEQVRGSAIHAKLVKARRQFINEAYEAGLSHGQIARHLNKDRSTISHHFRKMRGAHIPTDLQRHLLILVGEAVSLLQAAAPEDPRAQEFQRKANNVLVHLNMKGKSHA